MKRLAILAGLAMLLLCAPSARAQCSSYTQVTATLTDPNGVPWAGATLSVDLSTGASATCTGPGGLQVPFSGHFQTTLDPTGSFAIQLPPNAIISPGGTQWNFSISITVPPPVGRGNQSFSYAGTIAGASQSLSSALSALAPEILYSGGSGTLGSQYQIAYFTNANVLGGMPAAVPSITGAYTCGYFPATSTAVAPTCPAPGVAPYVLSGISSYQFQPADGARPVEHAPQDSVPIGSLCLPSPANLGNQNFSTVYINLSAQQDTLQACPSSGGGYQFIVGTSATLLASVNITSATRWQITASTADSTWRLVPLPVGINGSCTMSSGTTCTAAIPFGTNCTATVQGSTPIAAACLISNGTLTITAASSNSSAWAWSIVN